MADRDRAAVLDTTKASLERPTQPLRVKRGGRLCQPAIEFIGKPWKFQAVG